MPTPRTVGDLCRVLRAELGEPEDDRDAIEVFIAWAEEIVQKVWAWCDWPFTKGTSVLSVTAGASRYGLPVGTGEVISITRNSNGEALTYEPADVFYGSGRLLSNTGNPHSWTFSGFEADTGEPLIQLFPTPSADIEYTVYMEMDTPTLAAEDDYIPMPAAFHPMLRDGIRSLYYANTSDPLGEKFEGKYERALRNLQRRFANPRAHRAVPGYNDLPRPRSISTHGYVS